MPIPTNGMMSSGFPSTPAGWEYQGWDPYKPVNMFIPEDTASANPVPGAAGPPPPMDPFFTNFMTNFNKEEAAINKQRALARRMRVPAAPTPLPVAPPAAPTRGVPVGLDPKVYKPGHPVFQVQREMDRAAGIVRNPQGQITNYTGRTDRSGGGR